MTLSQFKLLSEPYQTDILWQSGVFIGSRNTLFYIIDLFQVEGFYVEVFYDKEQEEIKLLKSFYSPDQLIPYLNQINIRNLIE